LDPTVDALLGCSQSAPQAPAARGGDRVRAHQRCRGPDCRRPV